MGRIIKPGEIERQINSASSAISKYKSMLNDTLSEIDLFVGEDRLQGEGWTGMKNQMLAHQAVIRGLISMLESVQASGNRLTGMCGEEDLDEDVLTEQLSILRNNRRNYQDFIADYRQWKRNEVLDACLGWYADKMISLYTRLVNSTNAKISEAEEKLRKIEVIDNRTRNIMQEAKQLTGTIQQGLSYLASTWNGTGYSAVGPAMLSWMNTLNSSWAQRVERAAEYGLTRPDYLSDEEWKQYQKDIVLQIQQLEEQGWINASIEKYITYVNGEAEHAKSIDDRLLEEWYNKTQIIGSDVFFKMWEAWDAETEKSAKSKLNVLMRVVDMKELINPIADTTNQLDNMLAHFSKDLSPHDSFWADVAGLVQKGFPEGLAGKSDLAKNVHQFRYVIDAQQVAYVRDKYKYAGGSDEDKLAAYLRDTNGDWTTKESDRFHQKVDQDGYYPDGGRGPNIKITVNQKFHSEFILDKGGNFLYILDTTKNEGVRSNSVINGASFNYAKKNDAQHTKLDVEYGENDPQFRGKINQEENKFGAPSKEAYKRRGGYDEKQSIKEASDVRKKEFKEKVNE